MGIKKNKTIHKYSVDFFPFVSPRLDKICTYPEGQRNQPKLMRVTEEVGAARDTQHKALLCNLCYCEEVCESRKVRLPEGGAPADHPGLVAWNLGHHLAPEEGMMLDATLPEQLAAVTAVKKEFYCVFVVPLRKNIGWVDRNKQRRKLKTCLIYH